MSPVRVGKQLGHVSESRRVLRGFVEGFMEGFIGWFVLVGGFAESVLEMLVNGLQGRVLRRAAWMLLRRFKHQVSIKRRVFGRMHCPRRGSRKLGTASQRHSLLVEVGFEAFKFRVRV